MNVWAAVIATLGFVGSVAAADVTVTLRDEPTRIFAGQRREVPVFIANKGETAKVALEYRVFQLAGGVAAEIGNQTAWKEIPLNAGQMIVETLPVTLPEVKAPVQFAVKIFEAGATKDLGTLKIEAYPVDFLAKLKDALKDYDIAVFDEKDEFGRAFEKAGFQITRVKNLSDPILADKPVFLVAATSPSAGELVDLRKVARIIVCFAREGSGALDRLPIEGQMKNRAFVVTCERGLLANFADSPTAQINFIRAAQYALRRRPESSKQD